MTNLPVTSLTHIVNRLAFPAYAWLLEQGASVAPMFLRLLGGTAFVTLLAAVFLATLAEPRPGVLGLKWAPLAGLMPWPAVYGFLHSCLSNTGPLFNAIGYPQSIFKVNLLQLSVQALLLYPLIERFGDIGAGVAVLGGALVSAPLALQQLQRHGGLDLANQWTAVRPVLLPAAAMAAAIAASRFLLQTWGQAGSLTELSIAAIAGIAAYGSLIYWRSRPMVDDMVRILKGCD